MQFKLIILIDKFDINGQLAVQPYVEMGLKSPQVVVFMIFQPSGHPCPSSEPWLLSTSSLFQTQYSLAIYWNTCLIFQRSS